MPLREPISVRPMRSNIPASTSPSTSAPADEAEALLRLTVRLHTARGDAQSWRDALAACRAWAQCPGALGEPADNAPQDPLGPDDLEALAGRITHCANYGVGACGSGVDEPKRGRCAALAPHLHEAAIAARQALQASLFDRWPPTWIVDRSARVCEANAAAKALTHAGSRFVIKGGYLTTVTPGATPSLARALQQLGTDARLSGVDGEGAFTLQLRALADGGNVAVTLQAQPPQAAEVAAVLALQFGLTTRQSELAAHLSAGLTLLDAARAMGISRHTANEHLAAVLRRVGVGNRKQLFAELQRAVHR